MESRSSQLKQLVLYCVEHELYDTAEFTCERILAQYDYFHTKSTKNKRLDRLSNSLNTPTPNVKYEESHLTDEQKLDDVHLYAYVLYKMKRFKAAYNAVAPYVSKHVGCSYILAKASIELNLENDGIRALLSTLNIWEKYNYKYQIPNSILPNATACSMLLGKLYIRVDDIPRATMHLAKVLKLNPFMFEAVEELCKLGVKVNVDSIYSLTDSVIPTTGELELDSLLGKEKDKNTLSIFKTPVMKSKSGVDSALLAPIHKNEKPKINRRSIVTPSTKKNTSITSRLLHNNTGFNTTGLNSVNTPKKMTSSKIGSIREDDDSLNRGIPGSKSSNVFNNNTTILSEFGENDSTSTMSANLYILYNKLAKAFQSFSSYDCFKSIRILDSLSKNEKNTPWVLAKLGRLHFEIVNYEQSEIYFDKLRKIDRTRMVDMEYFSTLLWHLNKEVELSFLSHELYQIDSNNEITWICIGNLFSFKKEPEEAIKCFTKAIEINPKCAYAYTLQGHEYLATDAFENALNSFRHSLLMDKRHYNAFYGIGMVYLKLGDLRKAEFHFRKASEINPVNVILICCIGMVLEKLDKREESLKQYEFATKLQPLSMLALFKKAQVLFSLGQYEDALREFEKLENIVPDEASVHFLLGKLYKHFGRKHDAIKQFTISLNLDPKGSHLIKEALETLDD